jgi:chloramphenicol 3-O-phosphotransferase
MRQPVGLGLSAAVGSFGVKRVLLTGMSGTGKSSVVRALAARGYKAVDTDDGWSQLLPDGRQQWREHAIADLLATEDAPVLFVAGCDLVPEQVSESMPSPWRTISRCMASHPLLPPTGLYATS